MKLTYLAVLLFILNGCQEDFNTKCCYTCRTTTTYKQNGADQTVNPGKEYLICDVTYEQLEKSIMDSTYRKTIESENGVFVITKQTSCYQ